MTTFISKVTAKAVSVPGDNIDTDQIIPAAYMKTVNFADLKGKAFVEAIQTAADNGGVHPFGDPRFKAARILFSNANFGCGSSREHAPMALKKWNQGIEAIVAQSFSEIFIDNCTAVGIICVTAKADRMKTLIEKNQADPGLEFEIDLETKTICMGKDIYPVEIESHRREALMNGTWDSTQTLLKAMDEIKLKAKSLPYVNGWS